MRSKTVTHANLPVPTPGRVLLKHLALDPLTMDDVMGRIETSVVERSRLHVVTANMQFLHLAAQNAAFATLVARAGLVVGDGAPLAWLSRLGGRSIPQRITGHDLVFACSAMAAQRGYRVALLGGTEGTGETARRVLESRYPGLQTVGVFNGRFTDEGCGVRPADEEGLSEAIRDAQPDILFVALGCPKQEYWIHRHLHDIDAPVCIGVGGVFDVLSGRLARAPEWMQRTGLEWFYRFAQEPRRLWRRYFVQDLPMLARTAMAITVERVRGRLARW